MNSFQFQIFRKILNNSKIRDNIIISPLSIYHILSLATNGAAKKTLKEMIKVLSNTNLDEINKINKSIFLEIKNFKTVEFANAIFTSYNISNFEKLFITQINNYKAILANLESTSKVNKFCSEATKGKITEIIDKIEEDTKMILINAIYFKGEWEKKFDKNKTCKNEFLNYKKEKKLVDFMNIKDNFLSFEDDDIQSISLNYKNDNIKALIILPKYEFDIDKYILNFTADDYNNI